jgi:ADP-heptose:LPS heptosyltransferase
MRVLVIKETSLGDVLHSTGHVRAIRREYPQARLTLLTDLSSWPIYRNSPHVDEVILFDRYGVKRDWWRRPMWTLGHLASIMAKVRRHRFDLAIDLQGRWKSVIFLYGARARRRYVKGRWPLLRGFRRPGLHAIAEMDGVLQSAGIQTRDTHMEFVIGAAARARIDGLLGDHGIGDGPFAVFSPFTRWPSKNWPLACYRDLAERLRPAMPVLFTATGDRRQEIERVLADAGSGREVNLAGELDIEELAELVRRARLMVTGDSFPMHVACAVGTPVVALFGPTDETRVGPTGAASTVVRAGDCLGCRRPRRCQRGCVARIPVEQVAAAAARLLSA